MSQPMFFEKRLSMRRRLSGLLPGRLVIDDTDADFECRLVDVSVSGMGVLSSDLLSAGSRLTLRTKEGNISLEVSWGQPDFGKQDLYRYGLKVLDENLDLEEVFDRFDCFV